MVARLASCLLTAAFTLLFGIGSLMLARTALADPPPSPPPCDDCICVLGPGKVCYYAIYYVPPLYEIYECLSPVCDCDNTLEEDCSYVQPGGGS